jgi:hypothetical protein
MTTRFSALAFRRSLSQLSAKAMRFWTRSGISVRTRRFCSLRTLAVIAIGSMMPSSSGMLIVRSMNGPDKPR